MQYETSNNNTDCSKEIESLKQMIYNQQKDISLLQKKNYNQLIHL